MTRCGPNALCSFIKLVNAVDWNSTRVIPFRRNAVAQQIDYSSVFDAGNLDLKGSDRASFWAFSVVFGYQADISADGEPDLEEPLRGGTPKRSPLLPVLRNQPFGYSVIYMEALRDLAFGLHRPSRTSGLTPILFISSASDLRLIYWGDVYGAVAHELAHAPGRQPGLDLFNDHDELGLMAKGGDSIYKTGFMPKTIKRFRNATSWTE